MSFLLFIILFFLKILKLENVSGLKMFSKIKKITGISLICVNWLITIIVSLSFIHFSSVFFYCIHRNRAVKGIFPKSYVQVVLDVVIVKNEYVIRRSEIVDEITLILKEWHVLFKKFYLVSCVNICLKRQ